MLGLSPLWCVCLWGEHVAEVGQGTEHGCQPSHPVPRETSAHSTPNTGNQSFPLLAPCPLPPSLSVSLCSGWACIQSHSKWFCEDTERDCNVSLLEWMKNPLFSVSSWAPGDICHVALFHTFDCSVTGTVQLAKCFFPFLMISSHAHCCTNPWSGLQNVPQNAFVSVSLVYSATLFPWSSESLFCACTENSSSKTSRMFCWVCWWGRYQLSSVSLQWWHGGGLQTEILTLQETSCGVEANIAWPSLLEDFWKCS